MPPRCELRLPRRGPGERGCGEVASVFVRNGVQFIGVGGEERHEPASRGIATPLSSQSLGLER